MADAANEFGSGFGPSAGGEPEVSGLPATGTSAARAEEFVTLPGATDVGLASDDRSGPGKPAGEASTRPRSAAIGDHSSALSLARTGGGRTKNDIGRLAAELIAGGEAEAVGLRSLRGYSPTCVEIDGVPIEWPQPERKEASGVRVKRANGEIALYVTTTMERARFLLDEARKLAEADRG